MIFESRTAPTPLPRSAPEALARFQGVALAWIVGCVVIPSLLAGCGGRDTRSGVAVGPSLTAARLGNVRGALTYDGDWLGGLPSEANLADDLELARRRGVEVVIDLRSEADKRALSLLHPVTNAGMELVEILLREAPNPEDPEAATGAVDEGPITDIGINRVLWQLNRSGRKRTLLLDATGVDASVVYAIYLAVDEDIPVDEALRAARATGLDDEAAAFVEAQVARLRAVQ